MIEIESLVKVHPGNVVALDGFDLDVGDGDFVALTGPSGCGKSTLLHIVAGLDHPTSGHVRVDGRELRGRHLNHYRRREVGIVFQLHHLLPHLTARQNVEVVMFGTHRSHRERGEVADALLAELGLEGLEDRRPAALSGGERQRVAIARALANEPRHLLADEPTGSLDPVATERFLDLLRARRRDQGMTLLVVTHDDRVLARADRVVEVCRSAAQGSQNDDGDMSELGDPVTGRPEQAVRGATGAL